MGFVNSIKLALSKIGLAFKILFYDIVIGGIIIAVCAGVLSTQFEIIGNAIATGGPNGANAFDAFGKSVIDYISGDASALTTFFSDLGHVFSAVEKNFSIAFIVAFAMGLLLRFLINLRTIPVYDIVDFHMTESSNHYFLGNYMRNIGRSARYSLLNLLLSIPFDAVIILIAYYVVGSLFISLGFLAPFVIILFLVALFALRQTIFFFWVPLIVKGDNVFKAFVKGVKMSFAHFGEIFISMFSYNIMWLAIVVVTAISTYFVGLLVVVPMLVVLLSAMQLIKFHDINKLRYYSAGDEVIEPSIIEELEIEDKEQDYEVSDEDIVGGEN